LVAEAAVDGEVDAVPVDETFTCVAALLVDPEQAASVVRPATVAVERAVRRTTGLITVIALSLKEPVLLGAGSGCGDGRVSWRVCGPRSGRRRGGRGGGRRGRRRCGVEDAVQQPGRGGRWPGQVERHPGEAGQVTADPLLPGLSTGDPPVGELVRVDTVSGAVQRCQRRIGRGGSVRPRSRPLSGCWEALGAARPTPPTGKGC